MSETRTFEVNLTCKTNEHVRVCSVEDVGTGEMKAFDIESFPPLAVFNHDETFYVTSNLCTHQIALLTNGYFENGIVECPLHGGAFDVTTGEPTQPPCEKRLAVFPVQVIDGEIYVAKA